MRMNDAMLVFFRGQEYVNIFSAYQTLSVTQCKCNARTRYKIKSNRVKNSQREKSLFQADMKFNVIFLLSKQFGF